jgi:anti-sigma factor RsiW
MNQDHVDSDTLQSYLTGGLPVIELLKIDRHLAECARCKETLRQAGEAGRSASRLLRAVKTAATGAAPHLTYEQMEAYVDNTSVDRAAIEAHVARCAMCRRELQDLRVFAPKLSQSLRAPRRSLFELVMKGPIGSAKPGMPTWFSSPARLGMLAASVALVAIGAREISDTGLWHSSDTTEIRMTVAPAQMPPSPDATPLFGDYDDSALARLDTVSPAAESAYRARDFAALAGLLQDPAKNQNVVAEEALGLLYARGVGVAQDKTLARQLFQRAADSGSDAARRNLNLIEQDAGAS